MKCTIIHMRGFCRISAHAHDCIILSLNQCVKSCHAETSIKSSNNVSWGKREFWSLRPHTHYFERIWCNVVKWYISKDSVLSKSRNPDQNSKPEFLNKIQKSRFNAHTQYCMPMRHTLCADSILYALAPYFMRMRQTLCACARLYVHAPDSMRMRQTLCACARLNSHTPHSKYLGI